MAALMPYDMDMRSDATFVASDFATALAALDAAVSHALVPLSGTLAQRRVPIGPDPLVIGRVPSCDLVLEGGQVSRSHCRIEVRAGQAYLSDLGSTNGTFLDGVRVAGPSPLQHGAVLQVGGHLLSYERRTQRELEEAAAQNRDLQAASAYVHSLLPAPIRSGPVRTDWLYLPCAQLGGCGFGTRWLSDGVLALYMMGIAGHGTTAAMRSVAVMNLMGQAAAPGGDPFRPASVLAALDVGAASGRDPVFSLWYGVFHLGARTLRYASAGHFPGLLLTPGGRAEPLGFDCPPVGAEPGYPFREGVAPVPPGSALFLLGDGLPDLVDGDEDGLARACEDLRTQPQPGVPEPLRLLRAVRERAGTVSLDQDFLALVVDFAE